jgi:hypothetical protein
MATPGTNSHGVSSTQVFWWDPPVKKDEEGVVDFLKSFYGYCFENMLRADYSGWNSLMMLLYTCIALYIIFWICWCLTFWTIIGAIVFFILILIAFVCIVVLVIMVIIDVIAALVTKGPGTPSENLTSAPSGPVSGHNWWAPTCPQGLGGYFSFLFSQITRADYAGWLAWMHLITIISFIGLVILICTCPLLLIGIGSIIWGIVFFIWFVIMVVCIICLLIVVIAAFVTGGPSVPSAKAAAA